MRKNIITIALAILVAVSSFCQTGPGPVSGNYLPVNSTGYNWAWGYFRSLGLPTGAGVPTDLNAKQYTGTGAVYVDSVGQKVYIWYYGLGWQEIGSGSALTIPGNYGNSLINRNGVLAATDSFRFKDAMFTVKGQTQINTGVTAPHSLIVTGTGTQPYIITIPSGFTIGANNAWNLFYSIDPNVTTMTGFKNNGTQMTRRSDIQQSGLTSSFRFGHSLSWEIQTPDSLSVQSLNGDGFSAVSNGFSWSPRTGQTTRSVVQSGAGLFDISSGTISGMSIAGVSTTNNMVMRGWYAGFMSYLISTNTNHTDSVDVWVGYASGGAAVSLGARTRNKIDFLGGTLGGTGANIEHSWGLYIPPGSGVMQHNFLGGKLRIDKSVTYSNPNDLADNGKDTATYDLEVKGQVQIVDGTECAGCVFTDVAGNGLGSWQPGGGGGGTSPAGSNRQFQFNNNGAFGANDSTKSDGGILTYKGYINVGNPAVNGSFTAWDGGTDGHFLRSATNTIGGGLTILNNANNATSASYGASGIGTNQNFGITVLGGDLYFNVLRTLIGGNTAANSKLQVNGSFATAYVAKTGTYTATVNDYTIDCTSGTFTVTLPTAVGITGRTYVISNSGAGTITIATTSSQTFANVVATPTTLLMSTVGARTVQSNGANWILISSL